MHVRAALTALVAAAATMVIAGCGGASGGTGSAPPPGSTGTTGATAIAGVFLVTDSHHPNGGTPTGGVKVGLYLRATHAGGPIAADPPRPIATTTTGADGGFRFTGLQPGRRYFVFATGANGYSTGHWTRPGGTVRLVACTDCAMPL
jgi:hypothetical protein